MIGIVAVNGAATMTVNFSDVPGLGAGTYSWKECYTGTTGTGSSVSATLVAHDMAIFKVSKSGGTTSTSSVKTTSTSATSSSKTQTSTATTSSAAATSSAGGTLGQYAQCGGVTWTGSGTCE